MAGPLMQLTKFKPSSVLFQQVAAVHNRSRIGNRDVVGYGLNGEYTYVDHIAFPMPAIRFKENTPEVMVRLQFQRLYAYLYFWRQVLTLFFRPCARRKKGTGRKCLWKRRKRFIEQASVKLTVKCEHLTENGKVF